MHGREVRRSTTCVIIRLTAAAGAFAFFGPGQYEYLYGALNGTAADGRLQWAGELLSVRHA